jgi:hypothetical protein
MSHVGAGNVGRLALRGLLTNPAFELSGLWVSSEVKVGRDAGYLCGLDVHTGIAATHDLDAVLATEPECVVYCAMADNRMGRAVNDCGRILEAGSNVVGSAPVPLQYPWKVLPDRYISPLEQAAQRGNSSMFITGIDPGFANDLVPLAFAGTCQRIEQVGCMEIADYATYDGAIVMFDVMGFGTPPDVIPLQLQPGMLAMAWGPTIRQLAAGLDIPIDEITEDYEREHALEAFDIAAGHTHTQRRPGGPAVHDHRDQRWAPRDRRRTRHQIARRSASRLAAAVAARRILSRRNRWRTVLHRGHLPDQPEWRP